jgi:hypothetical protein
LQVRHLHRLTSLRLRTRRTVQSPPARSSPFSNSTDIDGPDVLWQRMCENVKDLYADLDSRDTWENAVCSLIDWLSQGGFPPTIPGGDDGKLSGACARAQ